MKTYYTRVVQEKTGSNEFVYKVQMTLDAPHSKYFLFFKKPLDSKRNWIDDMDAGLMKDFQEAEDYAKDLGMADYKDRRFFYEGAIAYDGTPFARGISSYNADSKPSKIIRLTSSERQTLSSEVFEDNLHVDPYQGNENLMESRTIYQL